jgi:hypothetical protein
MKQLSDLNSAQSLISSLYQAFFAELKKQASIINNNADVRFDSQWTLPDGRVIVCSIIDVLPRGETLDFVHAHYFETVEENDWGCVRAYRVSNPVDGSNIIVLRTTTDGDDGWVELFDAVSQAHLGAGRTYLELIYWTLDLEALRASTADSSFPEDFDRDATKWRTALPWK